MSDENFRRQLNQVFDEVTGSPSSNLPSRVRGALANPPQTRGPYWMAGVATAAIAILVVGVLVVAGPFKGGRQSPAGVTRPTPTPVASPSPFSCQSQETVSKPSSVATSPRVVEISALRIEAKGGYEELTIEFANGLPSDADVAPGSSGPTFTLSPSGAQVTLQGDRGILITIQGADLHSSYSGPTDIVTGDRTIAEVRRVQDFEGVVQLGLGLYGSGCYRVTWMSNPDRLVIDVQAA